MRMLMGVVNFMMPVLKPILPADVRTTATAGKMLVDISLEDDFKGAKGYYAALDKIDGSPESRDTAKQELIWKASVEAVHLKPSDTSLQDVF
jgi:hypothetical protein